ncbi:MULTISPECIES: HD-GYP domain-containing protein [Brevibacillus]|uniref:Phosphodiesterase n=1 Tax=Brevibacillus parabrevis TaxID=54914 RepID=A0A4Y3PFL0_BREPA|nr:MULTISPECIES: HD-GYP domain-containing protein [Brevibacillus]MBU8712796.1 HD-GYP domain-containing protein [Brevibacillus parabrevis]MDH6348298.1 putative nucleotidyltransferase with HDIG domain [Brevibacillus sp. 1238]MDR5000419.1 HD-GYP domain-containing protein [Brevibacillus parabrevis]MED2256595.1 HD-GYP domain-containing protein [Brevibacillus parabrevis]NRQ52820.1 HD-GYP domain-containing protein [Brevibacillus sp. HD1.4A]
MRLVSLRQVQPGMKLGRTVFTEDGKVLLGVGMQLTERLISGLQRSGVDSVYIDDPRTEDIVVEEVIRPQTRQIAVEVIEKTIKQITNSNKLARKISLKEMGLHFQRAFSSILDDLMQNKQMVGHLTTISSHSPSLYHHSVNVAVLATAVGMSIGYNRTQLMNLGVGAMLHDIGKVSLPEELLQKKERWNAEEQEIAKQHTTLGFNLLRKQHDISLMSAHVCLQHHERLNGSGYPQGLVGKQIHEFAQIVGICDIYDSLTSPRPWRKRYMPQDAVEYLLGSGGHLFEHHLVNAFIKHIAIFPIGSSVVLNTGETGVVSRVDPDYSHRPTVRILRDGRGNDVIAPYDLNLKENIRLFIIGFEDDQLFNISGLSESESS